MGKFSDIANAKKNSFIREGRDKMEVKDIIKKYPDGISITGFDIVFNQDGNEYAIFTFAEEPNFYFNGASAATATANRWRDAYDGDLIQANAELQNEPCKVKMYERQSTTSKRTMIAFDCIAD